MAGWTGDETAGGIDHAFLAVQTGGDTDLARELLSLFAGQCRTLVPGIAHAGRDAAERADAAHTLKGSAAGIGAVRIGSLCGEIEDGLRRTGTAEAGLIVGLEAAVQAAIAEIERAP